MALPRIDNNKYTLELLVPEQTNGLWAQIEPFISVALVHADGQQSAEQLRQRLNKGDYQAWIVRDPKEIAAICTSCVVEYRNHKVLSIVTLGGRGIQEWGPLLNESMGNFARMMHLQKLEAIGRKGLTKLLEPLGFKETATVVSRTLM